MTAVRQEASACMGIERSRLGKDGQAIRWQTSCGVAAVADLPVIGMQLHPIGENRDSLLGPCRGQVRVRLIMSFGIRRAR
jgi:hypothetical protein